MFPFDGYKIDYDNYVKCKDKTLKNMTSIAVSMSKSAGRVSFGSFIPKKDKEFVIESADPIKAFFAKNNLFEKRQITLSNMDAALARDDKMYV